MKIRTHCYIARTVALLLALVLFVNKTLAQDIFPDTWVATDALGRTMPTAQQQPLRTDKERTVGIFYITWHQQHLHSGRPFEGDVSRVLNANPDARLSDAQGQWPGDYGSWFWGEPEYGYFLSQDEYVIRHDMSMLSDAGVDVIILDVTNAVCYWDEWEVLLRVMDQMVQEGNRVPKFCFWAFNGNVIPVVQSLYDTYYRNPRYQHLWFYWQGKPLLLYNARPGVDATPDSQANTQDYSPEIYQFFTLRNMWWGYYEWAGERYVGTEDNWSFGLDLGDDRVAAFSPQELCAKHQGRLEEMAVTPAQHPISTIGKSWRRETKEPAMDERDMPRRAYVPWLGREVDNPTPYGIYFQDRWDEALQADPDFVYLNDWNEWTAGKYPIGLAPGSTTVPGPTEFLGRKENTFYFVDQYNAEYNRTIAPAKSPDFTDNYYMQMVQNIRRYKGVRPQPVCHQYSRISVDGSFADWQTAGSEYQDTRGDVVHRDHPGYGDQHYVDTLGRNDIVRSRVAIDRRNVYFYVQTAQPLTPSTDANWMLLLIDTDQDATTGWQGYDLIIRPSDLATARWQGNQMELSLPRRLLKAKGKEVSFDFKWADNPAHLDDIIGVCVGGDTAPNRRFNYRFTYSLDF